MLEKDFGVTSESGAPIVFQKRRNSLNSRFEVRPASQLTYILKSKFLSLNLDAAIQAWTDHTFPLSYVCAWETE